MPSPADHAATVLSAEAVKALRDAGPKDLLWLICDSHELLRARCEEAKREAASDHETARNWYRMYEAEKRRVAQLEAARTWYEEHTNQYGVYDEALWANPFSRAALEGGSDA